MEFIVKKRILLTYREWRTPLSFERVIKEYITTATSYTQIKKHPLLFDKSQLLEKFNMHTFDSHLIAAVCEEGSRPNVGISLSF